MKKEYENITLLDVLKFDAIESLNQSNTFTPYHNRYDITLRNTNNDVEIEFEYQCNIESSRPDVESCLYALVRDAETYECCGGSIDEFQAEFGYTKVSKCIEDFDGCKDGYKKLLKLCGSKGVYEWVKEHYRDY